MHKPGKEMDMHSGGGAEDRPIHTPTDAKFSCGGLPYVPKCDYGQRRDGEHVNDLMSQGHTDEIVGHKGGVQDYGLKK